MFKKSESNYFIKLLEYGESAGNSGLGLNEVREWAQSNGFNIGSVTQHYIECFGATDGHRRPLKMEYYSRLLEWRELQEARKASNRATIFSILAIFISVVALVVSYQQLNKPIDLSMKSIAAIQKSL